MGKELNNIYIIVENFIMLISLFVFLYNYKKLIKYKFLRLFPLYTIASIFEGLIFYFTNDRGGAVIINVFLIFELFFIYNFCSQTIKVKRVYSILKILAAIYIIIFVIYWGILNEKHKMQNLFELFIHHPFKEMFAIQNIITVIPILLYFKSLYHSPTLHNLSRDPVFLIFVGMFFCFSISIPVNAFGLILFKYDKMAFLYLYSINSIGYITMHLFFIKAYLNSK